MASVKTSKAIGLAPLRTSASNSPLSLPPAAQSPAGFSSSVSTPTSAQSPHSNQGQTPTPPTLLPTPSTSSTHTHHQPQSHSYHTQPQQPPHLRVAIQPAPARKSLPTSSLSAASPASTTHVDKMSMASVISPMPGPPPAQAPISMTTKEWVIPPRPKPGRKPATDTPPTKRKAQNRAAQRAFRERRAARVGELEEQLEAESLEHEKVQQALQDKVRRLEMDAQALQSRCEVLENMLDKERAERSKEVEVLRTRLHEATQQHPRQQSLPSIASVPQHSHTFAPQPLRHHRPSAPSRLHDGRASTSSLNTTSASARVSPTTTHRPATTHSFSIAQIISSPEDIEQAPTGCGNCEPTGPCACAEEAINSVNVGCGNCTLGSRCQCLEEVLNGGSHSSPAGDNGSRAPSANGSRQSTSRTAKRTIRSISPSSTAPEEKRPRGSNATPQAATEIDFTAMFSRKPNQRPAQPLPPPAPLAAATVSTPYTIASVDSPRPEDRCGFCEDGTYCACAEAAASYNNNSNAAPTAPDTTDASLTLPALNASAFTTSVSRANGQTRTPPPSEGDAIGYEILPDGSVKLPSLRRLQQTAPKPAASKGCGPNGPGTCAQCLSDPVSGLFCRSLAASFKDKGASGGCCGGGGSGGGCCKDKPSNSGNSGSSLGLSLSCADAYKTLASHKHFPEAADDISTWLPRLKAREPQVGGTKERGARGNGRAPIEVEAASIMSVLKGFDVRFGRGE